MKTFQHFLLAASILGAQALLWGCGGGGGSGRGGRPVPDPVNEGVFSADAFGYVDPNPGDYQPLSKNVTTVVEQSELVVFDPCGPFGGFIRDENDTDPSGNPTITPLPAWSASGVAVGQIDGDDEEDMVAMHWVGGTTPYVVELLPDGSMTYLIGAMSSGWKVELGDVDGDDLDEIVVIDWDQTGSDPEGVLVRVYDDAEHAHGVLFESSLLFELDWTKVFRRDDCSALLADLDGDGRDEISVLMRCYITEGPGDPDNAVDLVCFLDDHDGQYAELGIGGVWGTLAPGQEATYVTDEHPCQGTAYVHRRALGLGCPIPPRMIVGDFDRDHSGLELCVAHVESYGRSWGMGSHRNRMTYMLHYDLFAVNAAGSERLRRGIVYLGDARQGVSQPTVQLSHNQLIEAGGNCDWQATDSSFVAADLDGNRFDELVFVFRHAAEPGLCDGAGYMHGPNGLAVFDIVLDGTEAAWGCTVPGCTEPCTHLDVPGSVGALSWIQTSAFPASRWDTPDLLTSASLAVGDGDADGRDEVFVTTHYDQFSVLVRVDAVEVDGMMRISPSMPAAQGVFSAPCTPQIAMGDFDGDNLTARFTGHKEFALGDPLPLVLVAAPPTKSGISQNYQSSWTSYGMGQGTSHSYGTRAGITASASAGVVLEDPLGICSVSAEVTLAGEFAKTNTNTTLETHTRTFTGSYSEDENVNQGPHNNSYEYEITIADDPALVGEYLTINVPVDTRLFKWTIDFYNASMEPEQWIDPSVLEHTIGDPLSYMRQYEAHALLSNYVGWTSEQPVTVGQGSGRNAVEISVEQVVTDETQRSWSVTVDCNVKAGPVTFGRSAGIGGGDICTVTVSDGTNYEGVIGDIADTGDYASWLYSIGLVAYNRGVLCDQNNLPIGTEPGCVPYQVLTYWTSPTGTGY